MSVYLAAILATVGSGGFVATLLWLLTRNRTSRVSGAGAVMWIIALTSFLVSWLPGFIIGGNFGGSILARVGEAAGISDKWTVPLGVFLGISSVASLPGILIPGLFGIIFFRKAPD